MIDLKTKIDCSGCHGCREICPTKCISMVDDEEGFWYPKIDESKCIDCSLCNKVCPHINKPKDQLETQTYLAFASNNEIQNNSSSGGIFYSLASKVIEQKGVVFGAAFNENLELNHKYVESLEDITSLMGSKYLQSRMGNCFTQVKKFLLAGRLVLFSGTPCQVYGLRAFLMRDFENLLLIDIVCHGVPSPKVWKKYIDEIGKDEKIKNVSFRAKDYGWRNYSIKFQMPSKNITQLSKENDYMRCYLKNYSLRPSCYDCNFKSITRNSDITLGDFWGVEKSEVKYKDVNGVSLLIVHSKKGDEHVKNIGNAITIKPVDPVSSTKHNSSIYKSATMPKNRVEFFNEVNSEERITKVLKKYSDVKVEETVKFFVKKKLVVIGIRKKI